MANARKNYFGARKLVFLMAEEAQRLYPPSVPKPQEQIFIFVAEFTGAELRGGTVSVPGIRLRIQNFSTSRTGSRLTIKVSKERLI